MGLRWSREKMAQEMGNGMTKEKLDTIIKNAKKGTLPRADTLARMLEVVGLTTLPSECFGWGNPKRDDE